MPRPPLSSPETQRPLIEPVEEGTPRPRWSIMIPTYNCARYLRQTLESVLQQAPGPDQMQIEVVDDCSTKDDPEAVVREIGRGRVAFYRKPKNEGATPNFNTCLQRSRGHLVHLLHGDDYVLPGFYRRIEQAAEQFPDCALYATRTFDVDEAGIIKIVSNRFPELEVPSDDTRIFWFYCPIQCAGIVVRRALYEQHGGFRPSLAHTADWEMWTRAVYHGKGMILPEVLACYRLFEGNDTSRLIKTAANLRDVLACMQNLARYLPGYPMPEAIGGLSNWALEQKADMLAAGDATAAAAAQSFYEEIVPWQSRFKRDVKQRLRRFLR